MKKKRNYHLPRCGFRVSKTVFMMNIWGILLLGTGLSIQAAAYSQHSKVTIHMENVSLDAVIMELSRQTQLDFFYNARLAGDKKNISVKAEQKNVEQVLDDILPALGLEYFFDNETVIIREKIQQAQSASIVIKGTVFEQGKIPLPGATILIRGTTFATSSDKDGNFTIKIPRNLVEEGVTLLISFIGKKTQEIPYTGQELISVTLPDDEQSLSEVVIQGVFNRPAQSYTGSVVMVSKNEIQMSGNRNIIQTLGNIDPSFNIIENNEWGSDPNRLPELTVRGNSILPHNAEDLVSDTSRELNTPLILLDGFEITLRQLLDIDVNEIENIQLMKDAVATAQFGSRGANGVLFVTTSLPQQGKLRIGYNGNIALEIPDLTSYDLLNAWESLDMEYRAGHFAFDRADDDIVLKAYYNKLFKDVERGINTDWIAQPVRVGFGHYNRLSFSGGDQVFRYQMFASNRHVAGAMKGTKRNTFNAGITLTYTMGKIQFQNAASLTIATSDNASSYGDFSDYARMNPYLAIYDDDGKMIKEYDSPYQYMTWNKTNPMYDTQLHTVDASNDKTLTNNFMVDWTPLTGLTLSGKLGISNTDGHSDKFLPADHTSFVETETSMRGSYKYSTRHSSRFDASIRVNYAKVLNDIHLITLGINGELSESKARNYSFTAYGFQHEKLDFLANALKYKEGDRPSGSESHNRRLSYSLLAAYTLMERYNFDFNYRRDGSSQYGNNNRWQDFYSVGFSWNVERESFIKSIEWINYLKLRASVGINGFNTLDSYGAVRTFEYYQGEFYDDRIGSHLKQLVNDDLGWGKADKKNIGLDLYILNNRFSLMADFYLHTTKNQISSVLLPPSNGFGSYSANIMSTEDRGIELKATIKLINNTPKRTFLSLTLGGIHEKDKVLEISDRMKEQVERLRASKSSFPLNIIEEGKSRNINFVVPSLGISPSTGKELYLKRNGEISFDYDPLDVVAMGSKTPQWRGNIGLNFRYHNLTFNALFRYEWGAYIYNSTLIDRIENADLKYNVDRRVYEDRWTTPGQNAFFKGINERGATYASSRFLQKKKEFRCTSIDIRYDFRDMKFVQAARLTSLNAFVTFNDPFILSTIKQERGISYPFARNISMGITASF